MLLSTVLPLVLCERDKLHKENKEDDSEDHGLCEPKTQSCIDDSLVDSKHAMDPAQFDPEVFYLRTRGSPRH